MKRSVRFNTLLVRIAEALTEAIFPTSCLVCRSFFHPTQRPKGGSAAESSLHTAVRGSDFSPETQGLQMAISAFHERAAFDKIMARFLCPDCIIGFSPIESPMCSRCGVLFKSREGADHLCAECMESAGSFTMARAPAVYDQAVLEAIHWFKYKGKLQLARPLGMFLFSAFLRFWDPDEIDLIVPVPLHVRRLRMRGFNQAFLLVRDWPRTAETFNIGPLNLQIAPQVLTRIKWTEPQTGLGRKMRTANIQKAFSIPDPSIVFGKRILLVDDVYTTGATVHECAKVLFQGGAKQVDVLTLARAM